jgi:hypothetical protein
MVKDKMILRETQAGFRRQWCSFPSVTKIGIDDMNETKT